MGAGRRAGDLSHSGDWGQYGFLQIGDYPGARRRIEVFEQMAEKSKHPRAGNALALLKARYIIETEEWKVQPAADDASKETVFANGVSVVKTGDITVPRRRTLLLRAGSRTGLSAL